VETNKFSRHLEQSKEQHETMKITFTELYMHSLIRIIRIQLLFLFLCSMDVTSTPYVVKGRD
jgi:hypothetical protein